MQVTKKNYLYFIRGNANNEQLEFAQKNGLKIRNAEAHHEGDTPEKCDGVFGSATPEEYEKIPKVPGLKGDEPLSNYELAEQAKAKAAKAKADAEKK